MRRRQRREQASSYSGTLMIWRAFTRPYISFVEPLKERWINMSMRCQWPTRFGKLLSASARFETRHRGNNTVPNLCGRRSFSMCRIFGSLLRIVQPTKSISRTSCVWNFALNPRWSNMTQRQEPRSFRCIPWSALSPRTSLMATLPTSRTHSCMRAALER